jgi:hypothetical protein
MKYHDKVQLTLIIIAPPVKRQRATVSFRATESGWRLHTTATERKLS